MNLPTTPLRLNCLAPRHLAGTPVDLAIEQAVLRTMRADFPAFERLPVPVRYRATGAIQARVAARRAAGRAGERFTTALADRGHSPMPLFNHLADFVEAHSTLDFNTRDGRIVSAHASQSVFAQAFWARDGALYEPTPELHRLLDATDIADNLPVRLLYPPMPTLQARGYRPAVRPLRRRSVGAGLRRRDL